nr:hypothetical protein [Neobacillus sp. Marseille-Q6967]
MTKKAADLTEETSNTNTLVDTLWNQYEQSLEWSRKYRESRENAYLNAVKQTVSVNKQFRSTLVKLYQESRKTNDGIVKGVSGTFLKRDENSYEVTEQFQDVSNRLEKLALTPVKVTFEYLDRLDHNLEENSENLVKYAREQRSGWEKVTNQYIASARNYQKNLFGRFEESYKVLTNSK